MKKKSICSARENGSTLQMDRINFSSVLSKLNYDMKILVVCLFEK